jgi:methyl-accepting chemotaxis protein
VEIDSTDFAQHNIYWQEKVIAGSDAIRMGDRKAVESAILGLKGQTSPEVISVFFGWPGGDSIDSDGAHANVGDRDYYDAMALALASIILAVFVAIFIARWIVMPIRIIKASTEFISNGDLFLNSVDKSSRDRLVARGDELGALSRAVRAMREKLAGVVTSVQTSTSQVSTGSGQLSAMAQGLSHGASEQAANIEELTSSVEELASTIRHNADNTRQVDSLAQRVRENAEESGRSEIAAASEEQPPPRNFRARRCSSPRPSPSSRPKEIPT